MAEWFEKKTLGTLLAEAALRWGSREALYHEGKRWSFAELQEGVNRVARAFISLGIQAGDKVSLWMPNRPEWLYPIFPTWQESSLSNSSTYFQPLSNCETFAVGMAIIAP